MAQPGWACTVTPAARYFSVEYIIVLENVDHLVKKFRGEFDKLLKQLQGHSSQQALIPNGSGPMPLGEPESQGHAMAPALVVPFLTPWPLTFAICIAPVVLG